MIRPSWLPALVAGFGLLFAGCDEARKLEPKERRISLATTNANLCPNSDSGQAETQIVATVFGEDGSVAPDVPVRFSTDAGTLSENTAVTNQAGQAITALTTPRPVGDLLTVVGSLADGRSDDVDLNAPLPPFVSLIPFQLDPESDASDDDEFVLTIGSACNINAIDLTVSWSGGAASGETPYPPEQLLSYSCDDPDSTADDPDDCADGEGFSETGILNAADGAGTIPTTWQVDALPGRLHVAYRRDDPSSGTSVAGTYFRVFFKVGSVTKDDSTERRTVTFEYENVTITPSDGRPYQFGGERIAMPVLVIRPPKKPAQ